MEETITPEKIARYAIPIALAWKTLEPKNKKFSTTNLLPNKVIENQKYSKIAWHGYLIIAATIFFAFTGLVKNLELNVMNSPKKLWPQFIEIGLKNIQAKHLMFYFPDNQEMQTVTESFNAGGRIMDFDGDYFHLNDTNFAGAKSNLYVNQAVDQEIEVDSNGTITKTVTITYTNPEPQDDCNLESGGLCLNGLLRDWVRIYTPEGSELIEVLGSDIKATTSKDLGKTVFEAFIELRPESRTKLIVKYKLPFKYDQTNPYNLLIQKQPGSKNHDYTITFGNIYKEFSLDGDHELSL